jgi:probable rRNA maturation factor
MVEINNAAGVRFDRKAVLAAAEMFLKKFKLNGREVSLALVSPREMKKLNLTYRGKQGTTDVLSFPGDGDFLGEIVFDYQQIKKQAKELGHSAKKELLFMLIHGLLHLIGHEDDSDRKRERMIAIGEGLMAEFKIK